MNCKRFRCYNEGIIDTVLQKCSDFSAPNLEFQHKWVLDIIILLKWTFMHYMHAFQCNILKGWANGHRYQEHRIQDPGTNITHRSHLLMEELFFILFLFFSFLPPLSKNLISGKKHSRQTDLTTCFPRLLCPSTN